MSNVQGPHISEARLIQIVFAVNMSRSPAGHWTLDIGHWTFLQIFNIDRFDLIRQVKTKHS